MIQRVQLPVASWVDPAAFLPAVGAMLSGGAAARAALTAALATRFGADAVLLTQSGTAALVAALRLAVPAGGIVAFPGYACVDLAAAAIRAGVRVRVYDLEPETLSPDLDSVRRVLAQGADAIVVSHLFGYPADVTGVQRLALSAGASLIEDAAQAAGARLGGRLGGALGEMAVLSFGRGKGTSGGGGGALLGYGASAAARVQSLASALARGATGEGALLSSVAQWALGRPAWYWLPSGMPWLRLGEMVYHPAPEPAGISAASAALAVAALAHVEQDVALRRAHAKVLERAAPTGVQTIRPLAMAEPGYLRLPILISRGARSASQIGVLPGYPRSLLEQPELASLLLADQAQTPGSTHLRESLVTLPTHYRVTDRDLRALVDWLGALAPSPGASTRSP